MQRIKSILATNAQGKTKELLDGAKKTMGKEINIFSLIANSPVTLEGIMGLMGALSRGKLAPVVREQIALTVAGENTCDYCASAHTFLAAHAGVNTDESTANLKGKSSDKKVQAALTFASQLINHRGGVSEADVKAIHDAGYTDEEVIEIVAHVALSTFTNYFNEVFMTDIDFPIVHTKDVPKAA